jgi:SET domain-containing protein 6
VFSQAESFYTVDAFHVQGSRILSRSFNLPDPDDADEEEEIVAMIPMADTFNAASGCNNARLFDEEADHTMMSIEPIPAGAQIVRAIYSLS